MKEQKNQTLRTQSIVNQLSKRKPARTYNDQACHLSSDVKARQYKQNQKSESTPRQKKDKGYGYHRTKALLFCHCPVLFNIYEIIGCVQYCV